MNEYLQEVSKYSKGKYDELKNRVEEAFSGKKEFENVCIYACGSMGRSDMSTNSDLDLFFIIDNTSEKAMSKEDEESFFEKVVEINMDMGFKKPSRNGEFLKFTTFNDVLDIGSNMEDYKNSFTARLLLLLESKPLFNEPLYQRLIEETVDKYLCDFEDHQTDYSPLFVMNDILRYWYTLTINYEFYRAPSDSDYKKRWRRLKLKFARLITCFSLYLCFFQRGIRREYVIECIKKTPLERLEMFSANITGASSIVEEIEHEYSWYLQLRQHDEDWWATGENKESAYRHAEKFHEHVIHELLRLISSTNPDLLGKTELIL